MTEQRFTTIEDVQQFNAAQGMHFFEPFTMRAFRSKVYPELYSAGDGYPYIVTSEKRSGFREPDGKRRYTVRKLKPSGGFEIIGGFQQYATLQKARRAATKASARDLRGENAHTAAMIELSLSK